MKYCLNSNVGPALLNEADEIAITKEDFGSVYMIAGRYPNATMIVPEPVDEFDWDGLKKLVEAFPNRIIVCVAHAYALKMCAELKIPFFYRYAVTSFQEVRALKELGAAYIVVAPPLFFQLDKVKAFGIPIRVCPNKGGDLGILSANFAHDSWILPKEIDEYEDYIEGKSSTTSTIEVTGGTQVDIIREGDICTNMSVCAGERHQCHYVTPYGGILLGVNGDEVKVGNGSLYIKYTLDLNPNILSTNEVNIKFSAIKS